MISGRVVLRIYELTGATTTKKRNLAFWSDRSHAYVMVW